MSDPLEALAQRVEGDPFFLAGLLSAYARSEGLDDDGLARALGCHPGDLLKLRLCRAPRAEQPGLGEDVRSLAGHFGLAPSKLVEVVRRGQALLRLRALAGPVTGLLLAARDAP